MGVQRLLPWLAGVILGEGGGVPPAGGESGEKSPSDVGTLHQLGLSVYDGVM